MADGNQFRVTAIMISSCIYLSNNVKMTVVWQMDVNTSVDLMTLRKIFKITCNNKELKKC